MSTARFPVLTATAPVLSACTVSDIEGDAAGGYDADMPGEAGPLAPAG